MTIIKSSVKTRLLSLCSYLMVISTFAFISACLPPVGPSVPIEGPIAGTPTMLGSTIFDLEKVGYQQSEYFIAGKASSYTSATPLQADGKWSVQEADKADFKTRIVVYRPIDSAAFNGTVVIEWLNVSGGVEASADWIMTHTELVRSGYAWVGVSAQKAGIDGGGIDLLGFSLNLKLLNPRRYNSLLHPGDNYAYDIFSQAAAAVLQPGSINPLGDLTVQRAIAAGESQSADFMLTYVNAIAPIKNLFDGYFIHSRLHGSAALAPQANPLDLSSRTPVQVRDDLDVPVMMVQTETDLFVLGSHADRQSDSANFRLWEIAGTSHADIYVSWRGLFDRGNNTNVVPVIETASPIPVLVTCGKPINTGPQHFVVKAAMAALDNWLRNGIAPSYADRLETAGSPAAFVKDSLGNVLGGVRTPYVDAPIAMLSGEGQTDSVFCSLYGTTELFDSTQLASLYPDHATYVAAVNDSVDNAIGAGFLLQPDGDLIKTWAQDSPVGD